MLIKVCPAKDTYGGIYHSMIDWHRCNLSEPPLTMDVRSQCLKLMVTTGDKITTLPDLPNHTQAVERMMKLVTATSVEAVAHEERGRLIRSACHDCQILIR